MISHEAKVGQRVYRQIVGASSWFAPERRVHVIVLGMSPGPVLDRPVLRPPIDTPPSGLDRTRSHGYSSFEVKDA